LELKDSPDLVVCAGWMHILTLSFLEPLKSAPVICIPPYLESMMAPAQPQGV
jgi:phosphoribosylglycinamide formyltransferase